MGILGVLGGIAGALGSVTQFLPIIIAGIEKLFPNSQGDEKLEQAVTIIRLLFPQYFKDMEPELLAEFLEGITDAISGIVKMYNAVGVFKHKDTE